MRRAILQFDPKLDTLPGGKRLSEGMSAVVAIRDTLWLAHDETVAIERLEASRTTGALRYGGHRRFDLREFIALPARGDGSKRKTPEADLEGLSFCGEYLWAAGSHSLVRKGLGGRTTSRAIDALARIRRSGNRFLIARIPILLDNVEGPTPVRLRGGANGRALRAGRLAGGARRDALTAALRDDPHLAPFLDIPSKDNGFDIEGLAAARDGRLFLGLRGPVIDGWACVLEIRVGEHRARSRELTLRRVGGRALYRKHWLDLEGAGVRDLCFAGRDLLVLTGPPMRGKGTTQVRRWTNALASRRQRALRAKDLPVLLELQYREKKDHAEGMAVLAHDADRVRVMVIYDSASRRQQRPPAGMIATVHELALSR